MNKLDKLMELVEEVETVGGEWEKAGLAWSLPDMERLCRQGEQLRKQIRTLAASLENEEV